MFLLATLVHQLVKIDVSLIDPKLNGMKSMNQLESNKKIIDNHDRHVQYGRLLPKFVDEILKQLELQENDIFLDIGHGIGLAVIQAGMTYCCEAKGIEIEHSRNEVAILIKKTIQYMELDKNTLLKMDLSNIEFECRDLKDYILHPTNDFSYKLFDNPIKILVNNAEGVFLNSLDSLDKYIATLFYKCKPGSKIVSLNPIYGFNVDGLHEQNIIRNRNQLSYCQNASFYKKKFQLYT